MNLDLGYYDFVTGDDSKVLKAIELGMRNHQFVPV